MNGGSAREKILLCLAASWRPGGLCFAGKEFVDGKFGSWIRPVNAKNNNAISDQDCTYANGKKADVLDIVKMTLARPAPRGHQKENYEIAANVQWARESVVSWDQIEDATDAKATGLWGRGVSSWHGHNDKVPEAIAQKLTRSLVLIEPQSCELVVGYESVYGGGQKWRVRADFHYDGVRYNVVVTDPWVNATYAARGTYRVPESRLCISLSEVFNGSAIKLAASVITPDRVAAHG